MYYDGVLEYNVRDPKQQDVKVKHRFMIMFYALDIPDDEAQYWTGKLERINTMRIHDEVKSLLVIFKSNQLDISFLRYFFC